MSKKEEAIKNACNNFIEIVKSNYYKFKTLPEWLEKESILFLDEIKKPRKYTKYKRGQIIKIDFGINIGSELCYPHYAIVLNKKDSTNNDSLIVLPLTSKINDNRINLGKLIHNLYPNSKKHNIDSFANFSQITSVSKKRIFNIKKIYICNDKILDLIDKELIKNFTK